MEKIILKNNKEYNLIPNGIREQDAGMIFVVIASGTISEAQEAFEETDAIHVCDSSGTAIRTPITGYGTLDYIMLRKGVAVGQMNAGTDSDPVYEEIVEDVFEISMKRTDPLQEQINDLQGQVNTLTDCLLEMSEAVYG